MINVRILTPQTTNHNNSCKGFNKPKYDKKHSYLGTLCTLAFVQVAIEQINVTFVHCLISFYGCNEVLL